MRIGVDVDSVLADLSGAVSRLWNQDYPDKPIAPEDWNQWDFYKVLGISLNAFYRYMDAAWRDYPLMNIQEDDVYKSLIRLRDAGHHIHIITNRNHDTTPYVVEWLQRWAIDYHALTFNCAPGVSKFEYPIDVLIDDNPNLARQVPINKTLFLRDHPWNRNVVTAAWPTLTPTKWGTIAAPKSIRVDSVAQAVDIITKS